MAKKPNWQNRIISSGEEDADQLLANPFNARIHPQFQQQALEGVLDTIGWVQRVIVNQRTGHVVDGHLRVALAITRGEQVPVDYVDLTEEEEKAILASFDYITSLAVYDKDQLDTLLKQVNSDDARVQELLSKLAEDVGLYKEPPAAPDAQIDRAAELQQKWQVKLGDVWTVGKHTLICDDALQDDWQEGRVLMTDPPYGIEVDTSWLSALHIESGKPANMSDDTLQGDDGSIDLSFLFEYDRRMIWGFPYIYDPQATGWIVWDKQPGVDERGIVTPIEMASTTLRRGFDMVRCMWGGYYRAAGEKRAPHPTQKPVQVIAPFIEQWTTVDDVIYDPFGGSGTTMVACEQLGRQCRMIEISEKYCAVILERMSAMQLEPRLVE